MYIHSIACNDNCVYLFMIIGINYSMLNSFKYLFSQALLRPASRQNDKCKRAEQRSHRSSSVFRGG